MGSAGEEHPRLLDEQVSFYRAVTTWFSSASGFDDGTSYRIVKVPHTPPDLGKRLRRIGWNIKVTATSGPFYWGSGTRA